MEEIQEEWEYGLNAIRRKYGMESKTTLGSEDFFSALLALQADTDEKKKYTFDLDFLLDINKRTEAQLEDAAFPFKSFKELFTKRTVHYETELFKAMLLTILENIQNPRKYSLFLIKGYTNLYFDTRDEWDRKLSSIILPTLVTYLNTHFTKASKFNMPQTTINALRGGFIQYPKKTRKMKRLAKQSRKLRKYAKTMRKNKL